MWAIWVSDPSPSLMHLKLWVKMEFMNCFEIVVTSTTKGLTLNPKVKVALACLGWTPLHTLSMLKALVIF